MADGPTVQSVSSDPKFRALSPEAQTAVLSRIDPNFAKLAPDAQGAVLGKLVQPVSGGATIGDQLSAKSGQTSLSDQLRQMGAAQSGQTAQLSPEEIAQGEAGKKAGIISGAGTIGMMLGGEAMPAASGLWGALGRMFGAGAGAGAGNAAGQAVTTGKVDPVQALKEAAIGAGTQGAGEAFAGFPRAGRAGAALNDVRANAGKIPINVDKIRGIVGDLVQNDSTGGQLPPVARKFANRIAETGANNPLTYSEAKDFQSNISNLSTNEKMSMNSNTKRLVGELNAQLKGVLQDAADVVGKGDTFASAMKEYHQAMKAAGWGDAAIEHGWKVALGALGLGGAKMILDKF